MDISAELNEELLRQPFSDENGGLAEYKQIASVYACTENAIAVLSDMKTDTSYIYYGGLGERLGIAAKNTVATIHSIWEEDIFRHIHPEDLLGKHLEELRFYHFVKRVPCLKRRDYYLSSHLRMMDAEGVYVPVLHRMFYLSYDANGCARLSLCLYNAAVAHSVQRLIVNSVTGESFVPEAYSCNQILTKREKEVLRLVEKGQMSKEIASTLSISINTVNRHRQNILEKLQAGNSAEACLVARELGLLDDNMRHFLKGDGTK